MELLEEEEENEIIRKFLNLNSDLSTIRKEYLENIKASVKSNNAIDIVLNK